MCRAHQPNKKKGSAQKKVMSRAGLLFMCFWMAAVGVIASLIYLMLRGDRPHSKMWCGSVFAGYVIGCCIILLVLAQPKSAPWSVGACAEVSETSIKTSKEKPLLNILFSLSLLMIYVSSMDGKMTTINAKLAETNRQLERANALLMRFLQTA